MPLKSHAVYVWHCDRDGKYSLYGKGIENETYLRGVQFTNGRGEVSFQTIFPACYDGRYPHIHLEIYPVASLDLLSRERHTRSALLTTQLALPRDACEVVYATAAGYESSNVALRVRTLADDNVFGQSTPEQRVAQTLALVKTMTNGWIASASLGTA